jgi:hypothetical protein
VAGHSQPGRLRLLYFWLNWYGLVWNLCHLCQLSRVYKLTGDVVVTRPLPAIVLRAFLDKLLFEIQLTLLDPCIAVFAH